MVSVIAQRLGAADCQIAHGARARSTTELVERSGEIGIDGDLDARRRGGHAQSVPLNWYTYRTTVGDGTHAWSEIAATWGQ